MSASGHDEPDTSDLDAQWLRDFVAEQDVPCPACGYNLRGLTEARCPECNEPLVLRVNLSETSIGLLIAALVPPIGAASCGAVMLAGVSAVIYDEGLPPPRIVPVLILVPAVCVAVGIFTLWRLGSPRGRQWFRRLEPAGRRNLVLIIWGAAAAFLVLYLLWAMNTV